MAADSVERRQFRKSFCASSAFVSFHTASVNNGLDIPITRLPVYREQRTSPTRLAMSPSCQSPDFPSCQPTLPEVS